MGDDVSLSIDTRVDGGDWPSPVMLDHLSTTALRAAAATQDLPEGAEVSILFTDDEAITRLNGAYRGKPKPTNVLSFAANEGNGPAMPLLGDIVLALETITREAMEQGKRFDDHLSHLLIHGFLHLLGHDHETGEADAQAMEALETRILAGIGIADPYAETASERVA